MRRIIVGQPKPQSWRDLILSPAEVSSLITKGCITPAPECPPVDYDREKRRIAATAYRARNREALRQEAAEYVKRKKSESCPTK